MPRPQYHKVTRPSPKVEKFLGSLEARIMDYFWPRDSGTVRDVVEHLERIHPVAYTTAQTVVTRLVEKGLLVRMAEGKIHRFRAARSREEFLGSMSGRIVDDLLADFGDVAIAQFLNRMEHVAPEKLGQLLKLARDNPESSA